MPLGFILDWLIIYRKGLMKTVDLEFWPIYPFSYWTVTMVRGTMVGAYPYFFMDPAVLNQGSILLWLVSLIIVFLLYGLLLVVADNRR